MRIFLSAADASGDLHAAALLEALRRRVPDLEAFGLGGKALASAGLAPVVQQSGLAVAGLVEVVSSAPRVLRAYAALRAALVRRSPELCVLVDSPDLNLPLASVAHRRGVPVFYYIAPQVWAWRAGRVRKLRRRVDGVGVIFPFEEALLRDAGIAAEFVGHPLVDRLGPLRRELRPKEVAREFGIDPERPLLGLLPGSRHNEVERNLPRMLEAAALVRSAEPSVQVRLVLAPTLLDRPPDVPEFVEIVRERRHEAMALSTALVSAAGTATVEAALLGVPLVVMHEVNPLSFAVARRLTRVASSCMVNVIADEGVVPERLQWMARPAAVAGVVLHWIRDPAAREEASRALCAAARRLGEPGGTERAAELALRVARGG